MGFPILGPQNRGFLPLNLPQMVKYQQDPQKTHPGVETRVLGSLFGAPCNQPVREEKKVVIEI